MNVRRMRVLVSVVLGLLALGGTLALLGAWDGGPGMVYAQSGTGVIRVSTTGTDAVGCGGVTPCRTIQYAVDQALPGEEIRVAQGTYTGVSARSGMTQVVYISKTVTIRGGYTPANWTTPNPDANLTTVDAQSMGRVLVISGTITPHIEGLRITGGNSQLADLISPPEHRGAGGVLAMYAAATISNCHVSGNNAAPGSGGGLF
ncbi:unnamed protein product, partial [marine sediment metagenome]